ncbi:hypothetical protein [Pseudodesulfovibrio sp.]|uniref:hypothetical protein n=1 Tax=unclassified Pseudodesulfovibrio TaxID=2661612 RepID=UPI003B0041B3
MAKHGDDTLFDLGKLELRPLSERVHDLDTTVIGPMAPVADIHPGLAATAKALKAAREKGAARILMIGAHVLRSGVQRYLFDLMEKGLISLIAVNGACAIHDFEFALIGATTESVAKYIRDGRFGLWQETSRLNDIASDAARRKMPLGHAVGRAISEGKFPHRDISLFAKAYELGIPVTMHVGIGYDIVCEHPNYDGGAWGATSHLDFLRYTEEVRNLEGGVVMNFGSAIMAPEIYLKALSMARNAARPTGESIRHFTTLVCDLHDLPDDFRVQPSKSTAGYYFRPWKTMLVRTVADGGTSHYVKGRHAETVPMLWTACTGAGSDN